MADFFKGERKDVGVRLQARRDPFDFVIDSATFSMEKLSGDLVDGFVFAPSLIQILGHDLFYLLDTASLAVAASPYNGVFTVEIENRIYKFVIPVSITRIKRA